MNQNRTFWSYVGIWLIFDTIVLEGILASAQGLGIGATGLQIIEVLLWIHVAAALGFLALNDRLLKMIGIAYVLFAPVKVYQTIQTFARTSAQEITGSPDLYNAASKQLKNAGGAAARSIQPNDASTVLDKKRDLAKWAADIDQKYIGDSLEVLKKNLDTMNTLGQRPDLNQISGQMKKWEDEAQKNRQFRDKHVSNSGDGFWSRTAEIGIPWILIGIGIAFLAFEKGRSKPGWILVGVGIGFAWLVSADLTPKDVKKTIATPDGRAQFAGAVTQEVALTMVKTDSAVAVAYNTATKNGGVGKIAGDATSSLIAGAYALGTTAYYRSEQKIEAEKERQIADGTRPKPTYPATKTPSVKDSTHIEYRVRETWVAYLGKADMKSGNIVEVINAKDWYKAGFQTCDSVRAVALDEKDFNLKLNNLAPQRIAEMGWNIEPDLQIDTVNNQKVTAHWPTSKNTKARVAFLVKRYQTYPVRVAN